MDTRYVKWYAYYYTNIDGRARRQELPIYKCTENDYAEFFPIENRSSALLQQIKTDEKRGFFCLDWEAAIDENGVSLFGSDGSGDFGSISIIVMPCNMRLSFLGAINDRIDPECVANLDEQISYLGPMKMSIYHNSQYFQRGEYSENHVFQQIDNYIDSIRLVETQLDQA